MGQKKEKFPVSGALAKHDATNAATTSIGFMRLASLIVLSVGHFDFRLEDGGNLTGN